MKSERRKKILNKLRENGLDGLLFASGADFQYLAECCSYLWQRNCFNQMAETAGALIIPEALIFMDGEGKTTILTIPSLKDHFDISKNEVVVSYLDQFEDELSHIVKGRKIGIGRDCDKWIINALKNVDEKIETIKVENIFDDLRRIKDEKEIAIMNKLAKFTDEAMLHVVKHMYEGMTMFECERMVVDYGLSHGIQDLSFPPTCGFKTRNTKNAENIEPFEAERKLVPGTMVAFDIGYMDQGYCSDWGRTVYYGKAPEFVKKGYEALQEAQCYMIDKIRPGVTKFSELYGYICDKAEELGYYEYLRFKREERGGNGHHIGSEVHELPWMRADEHLVLQPGMIFCSEPKMFFPNEGYMRVEDMVMVTKDGAVSLSEFPRDLFEIGI
ncbi:MAG: aminopeptidase P family protein [Erysipelotrichaceae bacterium]|nr:aminopeptidase P family protein [Erysipelotrichaceae bacterium]